VPARFQGETLVKRFHQELIKCIVSAASNPVNQKALQELETS